MDARLKANWLAVTVIILGLVLLIGIVEDRFPPGRLGTWLMLGIVWAGFGGIFAWVYFHRAAPTPKKQAHWPYGKQHDDNLTTDEQIVRARLDQNQVHVADYTFTK